MTETMPSPIRCVQCGSVLFDRPDELDDRELHRRLQEHAGACVLVPRQRRTA